MNTNSMTLSEAKCYTWPIFLINDIKKCRKIGENWQFDIKAQFESQQLKETISFQKVCIQGFIEQKPCDDVMILKDCSGKVKLSNCSSAFVKNDNSIVKGAYCTVDGTLIRQTGLPEISAHKMVKTVNCEVSPEQLFEFWPYEVSHFKLFALGLLLLRIMQ